MSTFIETSGDDTLDFYEGRAIYHKPWWDGFQHHVALEQLTTRDLCLRVKEILERKPPRMYLDGKEDVILRYFITWFTNTRDVPYQVWIDLEGDEHRVFFYEAFSGDIKRFQVGQGMSIPKESLESVQTHLGDEEKASDHLHVQLEKCQMGSCGKPSTHRIPVAGKRTLHTTTLDVCDAHFQSIEAQHKSADAQRERKRLIRKEKNKLKPKVERKKKLPAGALGSA